MNPVTALASMVAVSADRLPPLESSWRVRTRLETVEPAGMALLSSWRKLSLSGWPAATDTGKSPEGTSGEGRAPGGATGGSGEPAGGSTVPTCSCQYHEPPVTGTVEDAWAGASVGKATDVNSTAATTKSPSGPTIRPLRATSAATERGYCRPLSGCLQGALKPPRWHPSAEARRGRRGPVAPGPRPTGAAWRRRRWDARRRGTRRRAWARTARVPDGTA